MQWWRSDDLWYWSLEALAVYVRAAAARTSQTVELVAVGSRMHEISPSAEPSRLLPVENRTRLTAPIVVAPGDTPRCRSAWVTSPRVAAFGRVVR